MKNFCQLSPALLTAFNIIIQQSFAHFILFMARKITVTAPIYKGTCLKNLPSSLQPVNIFYA